VTDVFDSLHLGQLAEQGRPLEENAQEYWNS
jgi:hypothetical protein